MTSTLQTNVFHDHSILVNLNQLERPAKATTKVLTAVQQTGALKQIENQTSLISIACGIYLRCIRQLADGTDLRYIQQLLGHSSSRTTEIYTHVSNRYLGNIKSPGDFVQL